MTLEKTLVLSGCEDSLQTLLVSNFIGVLSRGDFCGGFQIRCSKLRISLAKEGVIAPKYFCVKLEFKN